MIARIRKIGGKERIRMIRAHENAARHALIRGAALFVALLVFPLPSSASDELLFSEHPVPIAKHDVRPTQVMMFQPQPGDAQMVTATQFGMDVANRPTGAGTYDMLPVCTESAVKQTPLGQSTDGAERIDVVYFSTDDAEQVRLAGRYPGLAVPFVESAMVNPYYGGYNRLQCFARTIRIDCLPTRFRYVTIDGRYVSEYRTGARAWDDK